LEWLLEVLWVVVYLWLVVELALPNVKRNVKGESASMHDQKNVGVLNNLLKNAPSCRVMTIVTFQNYLYE